MDDLVKGLTEYARRRTSALYGPCPPGVPPALWRAYGPRYPGGPVRAKEQEEAREKLRLLAEQRKREEGES